MIEVSFERAGPILTPSGCIDTDGCYVAVGKHLRNSSVFDLFNKTYEEKYSMEDFKTAVLLYAIKLRPDASGGGYDFKIVRDIGVPQAIDAGWRVFHVGKEVAKADVALTDEPN